MNIKRLVGTLALSIAAFAAAPRAQAAGDIYTIVPLNGSYEEIARPVASAETPLVAGDVIRFGIVLAKRSSGSNLWRMHYVGLGSEAVEQISNPFQLGIFVSGELRYARYVAQQKVGSSQTKFIFEYNVRPGDIALPVVLAVGQSDPQPANAASYKDMEYHVKPSLLETWQIDDSTAAGAAATTTAVLTFRDSASVSDPDYDLRTAGFYVRTLGFDDDEEEDAWRSVPAGTKRTGSIHVDSMPTNTATLYVWSMDENVVTVDSKTTKPIFFTAAGPAESRYVATIKVKEGVQDYPVSFTGNADAAGKAANLVMSCFDDFSYYNGTGERYPDYLTATVKVTTAPDPYMTLTDPSGSNSISVEANTNTSTSAGYTEIRLKFSKAYAAGDVKIKLRQQINGVDVPDADDYLENRYLAILLDPDNDPVTAKSVDTVTMKAGETETRFYVFPLGTTADLKSPGLTLVPDVSGESPEVQAFFAAGTANQKNLTLKITDQKPEVSVVAPSSGYQNDTVTLDVTVSDNWRDLSAFNTEGYTVKIRIGGQEVLSKTGVAFTDGNATSFDVSLPAEGHPLKGVVQVWDATHGSASGEASFEIDVDPARTATPVFYPTSNMTSTNENLKAYDDGHYFAEGESPYFRVTLTSDAQSDMYAFLVPANEAASNCVSCAAYTNGLLIASGTKTSGAATIKFLDGYAASNPMRAMFKVDLRSAKDYNDPNGTSYSSVYTFRSTELVCTNVSPTIVAGSMEVNNTTVESGGTLSTRVPAGALVTYRARLNDPSSIDLKATGDKAIVSRWTYTDGHTGSKTTLTKIVTNANGYASCPISFGTSGTTQTIKVWARDKDDLSDNDTGVIDWGDCLYEFDVNVSDTPHVIISRDTAGEDQDFSFNENVDTRNAYLYVQLSELPTGHDATSEEISASNPLVVELTVEQYASDGVLRLATNRVEFTNSGTAYKKVALDLDSLNGQDESEFIVRGAVVTTGHNAFGQPWSDYYEQGESYVTVFNVDPEIASAKRTNGTFSADGTNTCISGESIAIHWKVSDILPDVTNGNFTITWSVDPMADSPTRATTVITNGWPTTTKGRKTSVEGDFVFAVPLSSTTVTMKVEDGDGGEAEVSWYINVVKTLSLYVNVFGPATSSQTKYNVAKGLGQGVVAVRDATKQTTTNFKQNWIFGEDVESAEVYAWGYPSTNTWDRYLWENGITNDNGVAKIGVYEDQGQFPSVAGISLMSVALTPKGMSWASGAYYDWSTMGGTDSTAGDYDNYFYRWFTIVSSDDAQSIDADANDVASIVPTVHPMNNTYKTVSLDTGSSQTTGASRAPVQIEAIFSREKFPKDNLGDINADYVPDRYVQLYGIGSDSDGDPIEVGTMPEDDLASLETYNGDKDADGNDAPDYFPSFSGTAYSTLIPGIPSTWTNGQPFTARYEIRGYGDGLNNAPLLVGIKNYQMDPNYSSEDVELRKAARDYTELEMLAWSLTGYAVDWTPECPTDPTLSDTDGDGFTDGYEYYFWYRAHVGDPDYFKSTGKIRRITGRRFDPRNPGVGTTITSEEIEALMNPREAYAGDAKMLDTDNDGLPDLLEYELGTNPFDFDTDGDGLPDGWEIMIAGLDPLTSNTYTSGKSDAERNSDGDAMAISSYELEQSVLPKPLETEHAKRWTFAVIDENGDSDGVQWYATANEPAAPVVGETYTSGWKLTTTVGSTEYTFFCASTDDRTNIVVYADDKGVTRLGETLKVRRIEKRTEAGSETPAEVLGYPYTLPFGTIVQVADVTNEICSYKIAEEIGSADANACWIYGKGSANAEMGEVAGTASSYGCLALARQKKVPAGAEIVVFPRADRDVAFLHYLCYQEFGFDPRTAWSASSPLTKRWSGTVYKYVGHAARTRAYTNYDEFLVYSFFLCNLTDSGETLEYSTEGKTFGSDATDWARRWYALTTNPQGPGDAGLTYKPIGVDDDSHSSSSDDDDNEKHYYGRGSESGADTDGDGVPDGWELYVMAGPKNNEGAYVFAQPYGSFTTGIQSGMSYATMPESYLSPFVAKAKESSTCSKDYMGECGGLNEFQNYEGLDSIAVYTNVTTNVVHEVDGNGNSTYKWFNKFFPTDPWTADTDGDGMNDESEREAFNYGGFEGESKNYVFPKLVDDGEKTLFPGGGLNPCSVDTDKDGLPDPWEYQFAGTPDSIREDEALGMKASSGYRDGMDGTVQDAYTKRFQEDDVNRDYDNDGLENWQEYLTGTMRCWRYDDPISPLTYVSSDLYYDTDEETGDKKFNAATAAKKMKDAGYLETDDVNEFWYRTLVDTSSEIYNPGLVTDMSPGAQYFTRVTNVWDPVYVEPAYGGAYYWFYDRVNGTKFSDSWKMAWKNTLGFSDEELAQIGVVPEKYACCSPIDPDSDHDGMDDYYELFHGMNPLLGQSGGGATWTWIRSDVSNPLSGGVISTVDPVDLVYDSLGGLNEGSDTDFIPRAWGENRTNLKFMNFWQLKAKQDGRELSGNGYDFVAFPWLNGGVNADPDGDGIRNQEEAIMPLVNPTVAWHHTDPTPLWMTDVSYSNSLVRMFYRLPTRGDKIEISDFSFTYPTNGGTTYRFKDFGGFASGDKGTTAAAFNPDSRWTLVSSAAKDNYITSFEENEGYDSDHDGLMDQDELGGKYNGQTDPLDADSPRRRQAMYFQGPSRPSILQTMPFACEYHPLVSRQRYPDDMSFLQFTVECWVKAESLDDATIVERMIEVERSNPDDREYMRRNFSIGIKGGKWVAAFDPNDTTKASVEVVSVAKATTEWTHVAVTYDMNVLKLFINGRIDNKETSCLQPTYGSSAVAVSSGTQLTLNPGVGRAGMAYWADIEYKNHAIVVGAGFKTYADGVEDGSALDVTKGMGWDSYKDFFTGYVDEIRIWDGARSETEIGTSYNKRFTSEDAKTNRAEFYAVWSANSDNDVYRGRYAKDATGSAYELPAELRFHWAFDSLFGGASEGAVAKAPSGFNYLGENVEGDGGRALRSRPEGYFIPWWSQVLAGYTDTVYSDPAWICWVPNTVTHLPRYDGTTLDSFYWSEDFKGATNGTYKFTRTAEPVSLWRQAYFMNADSTTYRAPGVRYTLVTDTDGAYSSTTFTTRFEFTGRHLNQSGDDMLALGGAYAKHVDEMWDGQGPSANWEIAGTDQNGNGLPDWWEELAEDLYRDDAVTGDGAIDWTTMVRWPDQDGTVMTAGEAYLRDLARGYHGSANGHAVIDDRDGDFAQRADENGNGIPDWWEKMYGIEGEDAFDDHDNDGLCNLVEYILSERFSIRDENGARLLFNPTIACSVKAGVLDYFFKVGQLYVGEIFGDHDFIEDAWEHDYDANYASALVYDAIRDDDDDGWSTFAEARYSQMVSPIQADGAGHYDSSGARVPDYPIPTLQLTVNYNGTRVTAALTNGIGVYVSRDLSSMKSVDASFYVSASKPDSSSSTETDASNTNDPEYQRILGRWSDRHVSGTLTPGYLKSDRIEIRGSYDPGSATYSWVKYNASMDDYTLYRGTISEYSVMLAQYGSDCVQLLSAESTYTAIGGISIRADMETGVATLYYGAANAELGTINLNTGDYDLDLGVLKGGVMTTGSGTNTVQTAFEDLSYSIAYKVNPSTGTMPRKLYLGEASDGYIREGKNQIFVWIDMKKSGNTTGKFDVGEPCGFVRDVDISWRKREVEVEVFDHSPVMPRISFVDSTKSETASSLIGASGGNSKADRSLTVSEYCEDLIRKIEDQDYVSDSDLSNRLAEVNWVYTNRVKIASVSSSSSEHTRVRIVRWIVDGEPVYRIGVEPEVVFDKKMTLANRAYLTEADILADGGFDLDWDKLKTGVVDWAGAGSGGANLSVTNVGYLVVIGDGRTYWNYGIGEKDDKAAPVVLDRVIERRFALAQDVAVPFSPGDVDSVVYASHPTFKWSIQDEDDADYDGSTAFCIQILDATGKTVVWDSGTQFLPPRDSYGRYSWEAPAYVGEDLQKSVNYMWRVSVMNAKFPTPNWSKARKSVFRLEPDAIGGSRGKINVCVRYFGPKTPVLDQGTVRVEAFESPDFTGTPAARAVVPTSEYDAIASSDSNTVAQVSLSGLPYGKYYVRAYVDSNAYGTQKTRDDWESWGYYCTRDGSTSEMFKPTAMEISSTSQGDLCTIYMEDTDVNGNRIPDAYEMYANGGVLDNGTENLDETLHCGLAINTDLVGSVEQTTESASDYEGTIAHISTSLKTRAIAALAMGVAPSSITADAVTGALIVNPTVEDGTFAITGVSFDKENGQVSLTLDGDVVAAENVTSTIYTVKKGSTITVKVYRSETLAEEPTLVDTKSIVVSGDTLNGSVITVDTDLTTTSGFFKVVVE